MNDKLEEKVWVRAETGLSFQDMQAILPQAERKHGVYGNNNDITKVTLYQNLYKQDKLAEIFFDETEYKFLFDPEAYDYALCTAFGDGYASFISGFSLMKQFNPSFTFEHLIYDFSNEMKRYIDLPKH